MKCNKTLDILMLIDLTPKNGKKGFAAEIQAAKNIVNAWECKKCSAMPQFAIIPYTGPRTWSGVSKCAGKTSKKIDTEKVCKVKIDQHFSNDRKKTKKTL